MLSCFGAGVFTLLTMSIGEELESQFFKVLSCVSSILFQLEMDHLLTLAFSTLGIDRGMCHHVARDCCRDCAAFYYGQDVLCAMPRYGYVSESSEGRGDSSERFEDGCSVNFVNLRDLKRQAWTLRMTRY
jgi:hypothetical protein